MAKAFKVKHSVKNLGEFKGQLQAVQRALRNRILRKAITAGGRPVLKAMRARAPSRTGLTRRSLGTRTRTYRGSGVVVAIIGPRTRIRDPKTGHTPAKVAHLVEFGHANAPPHPFVRPAFDSTVRAAEAAMAQVIREELAKLRR